MRPLDSQFTVLIDEKLKINEKLLNWIFRVYFTHLIQFLPFQILFIDQFEWQNKITKLGQKYVSHEPKRNHSKSSHKKQQNFSMSKKGRKSWISSAQLDRKTLDKGVNYANCHCARLTHSLRVFALIKLFIVSNVIVQGWNLKIGNVWRVSVT